MATKKDNDSPSLAMRIDIRVLEHLGLKMYTSLPAVIAEYVANSWDAGAKTVSIVIPDEEISPEYSITISDNGLGMSLDEVQRKFLIVGRHRRQDEGSDEIEIDGNKRMILGRKGIGKIAGFGVAGVIRVKTIKDSQFIEFLMDYDEMQKELQAEEEPDARTLYKPHIISWGETEEKDGTTVVLTRLKRERRVSISNLRRNLARYFSMLDENFVVSVNDEPISPAERELKQKCQFIWEYPLQPINDENEDLKVSGWIGTMPDTVPPEEGRGVVVMARKKLVQTPSTFDAGGVGFTGMFGLAYLVGEINADFLDEDQDLISTGRQSVVWEQEPAQSLREWLNKEIKEVCKDWTRKREELKMQEIRELAIYSERIEKLPKREKEVVDRFLGKMASREDTTPETVTRVADFMASSVEYRAFLDLMSAVDESDEGRIEALIQFFEEWEVLDAIDMIRIVEGRQEAIEKFQNLVRMRAREVPTLHSFLVDNPWLLDPTWDYLDDEVSFRDLLLKQFPESDDTPEENKRIDFLCLGHGNTLNVIELKRPGSAIGRTELEQIAHYVDFASEMCGTDRSSYTIVVGYIIGGHISATTGVRKQAERLARDGIYIRTFNDLKSISNKVHRRFLEILKRKKDRIGDTRLEEGIGRLEKKIPAEVGPVEAEDLTKPKIRRPKEKKES